MASENHENFSDDDTTENEWELVQGGMQFRDDDVFNQELESVVHTLIARHAHESIFSYAYQRLKYPLLFHTKEMDDELRTACVLSYKDVNRICNDEVDLPPYDKEDIGGLHRCLRTALPDYMLLDYHCKDIDSKASNGYLASNAEQLYDEYLQATNTHAYLPRCANQVLNCDGSDGCSVGELEALKLVTKHSCSKFFNSEIPFHEDPNHVYPWIRLPSQVFSMCDMCLHWFKALNQFFRFVPCFVKTAFWMNGNHFDVLNFCDACLANPSRSWTIVSCEAKVCVNDDVGHHLHQPDTSFEALNINVKCHMYGCYPERCGLYSISRSSIVPVKSSRNTKVLGKRDPGTGDDCKVLEEPACKVIKYDD